MPLTPHSHDFDNLRTFVAKFCRNNLRTFSAKSLGLKNSYRQLIFFLDVWISTGDSTKKSKTLYGSNCHWQCRNQALYSCAKKVKRGKPGAVVDSMWGPGMSGNWAAIRDLKGLRRHFVFSFRHLHCIIKPIQPVAITVVSQKSRNPRQLNESKGRGLWGEAGDISSLFVLSSRRLN